MYGLVLFWLKLLLWYSQFIYGGYINNQTPISYQQNLHKV